MAEYEALVQGLQNALGLGISHLIKNISVVGVFMIGRNSHSMVIRVSTFRIQIMRISHLLVSGDTELVVNQIIDKYEVHNPRLKQYHRRAKELIKNFLYFNIQAMPRAANHIVDTFALDGSCFTLDFIRSIEYIKVQILHRPALPDNVDSWEVFDSDKQICRFLQNKEEFEDLHIIHELEEETGNIIQLNTNNIPPSLSVLESMFDSNDATTFLPSIDRESIRKVQEAIPINPEN
jgi:hypothetical protein